MALSSLIHGASSVTQLQGELGLAPAARCLQGWSGAGERAAQLHPVHGAAILEGRSGQQKPARQTPRALGGMHTVCRGFQCAGVQSDSGDAAQPPPAPSTFPLPRASGLRADGARAFAPPQAQLHGWPGAGVRLAYVTRPVPRGRNPLRSNRVSPPPHASKISLTPLCS